MKTPISQFQQLAARLLLCLFLLESCQNANIPIQQEPKQVIKPSSNHYTLHHTQTTSTSSTRDEAASMSQALTRELQLARSQEFSEVFQNSYSETIVAQNNISVRKSGNLQADLGQYAYMESTSLLQRQSSTGLTTTKHKAIKSFRDRKKLIASQKTAVVKRMAALLIGQICRVQGGWKIKFENNKQGDLQAIVEDRSSTGFTRQTLPVIIEPGFSYSAAAVKNPVWQKQHIHVKQGYVYVGSNGLKGGMMEGEKEKEKEDKQVGQKSPDEYSIKDVQDFIEVAAKNAEKAKGKEIVLVLGNTGSGKSTIINYLLGSELERNRDKKGAFTAVPKDSEKHWAKIGHGLQSETFLPSIYSNNDSPFVFCDCPGFNDTRIKKERLNTTIATQLIVNAAERIRAIIVVIDVMDLTHDRGAGMRNISKILSRLIKGDIDPNSILFVFNDKIPPYPGFTVELDGIHETVTDLEKIESEKLEKLYKIQQEGKGSQEEYENSSQILSMLKMISNNKENTFRIDLFDEFRSKATIEKMLGGLQATPKNCFSFSEHDKTRVKFNEQLTKVIADLSNKMMALMHATQNISINDERIESCEERIEFYKEQIELLDPEQKIKNEEKIPALQEQIRGDDQKIENLKKKSLTSQNKLANLAKEKAELDTDEEFVYREIPLAWNKCCAHGYSHYSGSVGYAADIMSRTELIYNEAYNIVDPEDCKCKKYFFDIHHNRSFYEERIHKHVVFFEPNLELNPGWDIFKKMNPYLRVYTTKKLYNWSEIREYDKLLKKEQEKIEAINKKIQKVKSLRKGKKKLLSRYIVDVEAQRKKIADRKQYLAKEVERIERIKVTAESSNKEQYKIREDAEKYLAEREQLLVSINTIISYGIRGGSKLDEGFKEYYQHYTALVEQGSDYLLSFPEKELPEYLFCPLRGDLFIDPVMTACSHTLSCPEIGLHKKTDEHGQK